jgi:hypothetical protein
VDKIKVLKISKEDLERAIPNIARIKPILQKYCLKTNKDGQGEKDSDELGKDFDTAIDAMITVLGVMKDAAGEEHEKIDVDELNGKFKRPKYHPSSAPQ